jgi:hypothetical protein
MATATTTNEHRYAPDQRVAAADLLALARCCKRDGQRRALDRERNRARTGRLGTGITNTTSANVSTKTRPNRAAPADRRAIPDQAQRACRSSRRDPHNSRSWTTIARFRGRGMTRLRSRDSGETSHWEPTASRRRTGGRGCCGSMCAANDAPPASRASAGADRAERRLRVLDRRIDTTQREAGGGGAQRAWTVLTQRAGAQRHPRSLPQEAKVPRGQRDVERRPHDRAIDPGQPHPTWRATPPR